MNDKQFHVLTSIVCVVGMALIFAFVVGAPSAKNTNVSSSLRDDYMKACALFLKNDATGPCSCRFDAHSIGGSVTIAIMIPYYRREYSPLVAFAKSARLISRKSSREMREALSHCPNSWTPDKGWH